MATVAAHVPQLLSGSEALSLSVTPDPVAEAARQGLSARPRYLPAWLFYDANGSRLFERITELPEYYLTRTERAIFAGYADSIIESAFAAYSQAHSETTGRRKLRVLELGAGTASKTGILLSAAVRAQGQTEYLPIDISADAMDEACAALARTLGSITVRPQVANYVTDALSIPPHDGPTLAMYIGSSIGNFAPEEAVSILQNLHAQLCPGDTLLLGTDLVKDTAVLEAAYCDADMITEAFNLNVLRRLNRELGANFDLAAFRHVACFNRAEARIEMHLKSMHRQAVRIPALHLGVDFEPGETIHTENSYKFTAESIDNLLERSGFAASNAWTDEKKWFAVTLGTRL